MADEPPIDPNPQFGEDSSRGSDYYFRGESASHLDPDRLQQLSEGYFGLNIAFLVCVAVNVTLNLVSRSGIAFPRSSDPDLVLALGLVAIQCLATLLAVWRPVKKVGAGMKWSDAKTNFVAIAMAINGALCCGAIGFVIIQQVLASAMKKYGVHSGPLGLKKPIVSKRIDEIRAQQNPPADS